MTSLQPLFERNQEATVYVGNCDQKVTEEVLWELFVQCGPVVNVHMPRDKITGEHQVRTKAIRNKDNKVHSF